MGLNLTTGGGSDAGSAVSGDSVSGANEIGSIAGASIGSDGADDEPKEIAGGVSATVDGVIENENDSGPVSGVEADGEVGVEVGVEGAASSIVASALASDGASSPSTTDSHDIVGIRLLRTPSGGTMQSLSARSRPGLSRS